MASGGDSGTAKTPGEAAAGTSGIETAGEFSATPTIALNGSVDFLVGIVLFLVWCAIMSGGWPIRVTRPPSCGVVCSTAVQREGSSPNEEATFASFPPGFEGRRNGCDRGLFVVRQQHPIQLHRQYDRRQRSGRHRFDRRFDGQRYRRHGGHDHRERYDRCFDWRREHDGQRDHGNRYHGNRYHGQRNDG